MNKKWEIGECNKELVQNIAEENNISELIAEILINRGITEKEKIRTFLNPTRDDFYDPFLMPDMEKAVNRLDIAIKNNEKVIIYGDYDADGITSITVLKKFLNEIGMTNVDYYVPNRLDEGYGLNSEAINKIHEEKYTLILTVDCGITGMDEIEQAKKYGIDVIVTDHHEPLSEIPDAIAVIDCKRKDSNYPFKELAGVGVVFKLIQGLSKFLKLDDKEYLKYLDLVCIGTISDIVPLIDENRVISNLGLRLLSQTKCVGLRALINANISKNTLINATTVSFILAPRINACGRMGHEKEAVELFLTDNIEKANELTLKLNRYNVQRQEIEKKIYSEALEIIENKKLYDKNTIVICKENWHHGVIGIVASKITEKYYKPSILVGIEDGIGKGSGRSIDGFDLHEALCESSEYLEKFGGHSMAVGITVEEKNFDEFADKIEQIASEAHTENLIPVIYADEEISIKQLNFRLLEDLSKLEPYGTANKEPVFLIRNLKIDSIRSLSEGKHLKMTLTSQNQMDVVNAIGFGLGNYADEFLRGDKIDVIGSVEINEFNNSKTIQIIIKDLRRGM